MAHIIELSDAEEMNYLNGMLTGKEGSAISGVPLAEKR